MTWFVYWPTFTTAALQEQMQQQMQAMSDVITDMAAALHCSEVSCDSGLWIGVDHWHSVDHGPSVDHL